MTTAATSTARTASLTPTTASLRITIMSIEAGAGRWRALGALALAGCLGGCGPPSVEAPSESPAGESWSVTAWGTRFEVFPEADPLVAGALTVAHTHVTRLDGFAPLVDGEVDIVLAGAAGEQVFGADRPVRPGIFAVEIEPESAGDFELSFRVRDPEGTEEIRGGRVRVGTAREPGALVVAPAPRGAADAGEPVTFLKEEQWRGDFATMWVRPGRLAGSVAGLARVRPPAGGEAVVTAPVDGVLRPAPGRPWPYPGLVADRGDSLFEVVPHVAAGRSLAALESETRTLAAELLTAGGRLARLEELAALEAVSRREVEEARVRAEMLEARHAAAASDLEAARSARQGRHAGGGLRLRAPFAGEVAGVDVSPGATVAAGDALARWVRTDVVWLDVALPPAGVRRIAEEGVRGIVLTDREQGSVRVEEGLSLVSVAPEASPETGTVTVLLEVPAAAGLILGTALEARVLLTAEREGLVIPSSALVDDGGVPVVYLQLSGESFMRQEVEVHERQGDRLLAGRLLAGQRLVSRGGDGIRRSSLMASGAGHGHVH